MSGSFRKKRSLTKELISEPKNFVHLQHVGFDQRSTFSVDKLDERWKQLIQSLKNRQETPKTTTTTSPKPAPKVRIKPSRDETDDDRREAAAAPPPPPPPPPEADEKPETPPPPSESSESTASDEDSIGACLSSNEKFRLSVIWNLLTNDDASTSARDVVDERYAERIRALEAEVDRLKGDVGELSGAKEQLDHQIRNLEAENAAVRSQCGALKQENVSLSKQYGQLRTAKEDVDKKAEVMVKTMDMNGDDFEFNGDFSGEALAIRATWCGAFVTLHKIRSESRLDLAASAQLAHPCIVSIFGFLSCAPPEELFVVVETTEGSLGEVIGVALDSDRYLTKREQIDLAMDCAAGTAYLHAVPKRVHGSLSTRTIYVTTYLTAKLSLVEEEGEGEKSIQGELRDLGAVLAELISGLQSDDTSDMMDIITDSKLKHVCSSLLAPAEPIGAGEARTLLREQTTASRYQRCATRRMIKWRSDEEKVAFVE